MLFEKQFCVLFEWLGVKRGRTGAPGPPPFDELAAALRYIIIGFLNQVTKSYV